MRTSNIPRPRTVAGCMVWVAALVVTTLPGVARGQSASVEGMLTARDPRAIGIVVYLTPMSSPIGPLVPVTTTIDQRGLKFSPRTIAVTPGSIVSFANSDPVLHNIFLVDQHRMRVELGTYPRGEFREVTLASSGVYLVLCHLHPEMAANVLVVDAPHRAVTDSSGRFRIDGIEPGSYRVSTWHRRLLSYEETIRLDPGATASVRAVLSSGARGGQRSGKTGGRR